MPNVAAVQARKQPKNKTESNTTAKSTPTLHLPGSKSSNAVGASSGRPRRTRWGGVAGGDRTSEGGKAGKDTALSPRSKRVAEISKYQRGDWQYETRQPYQKGFADAVRAGKLVEDRMAKARSGINDVEAALTLYHQFASPQTTARSGVSIQSTPRLPPRNRVLASATSPDTRYTESTNHTEGEERSVGSLSPTSRSAVRPATSPNRAMPEIRSKESFDVIEHRKTGTDGVSNTEAVPQHTSRSSAQSTHTQSNGIERWTPRAPVTSNLLEKLDTYDKAVGVGTTSHRDEVSPHGAKGRDAPSLELLDLAILRSRTSASRNRHDSDTGLVKGHHSGLTSPVLSPRAPDNQHNNIKNNKGERTDASIHSAPHTGRSLPSSSENTLWTHKRSRRGSNSNSKSENVHIPLSQRPLPTRPVEKEVRKASRPFDPTKLRSVQRHAESQAVLARTLTRLRKEERRRRIFHARPLPRSHNQPAPPPITVHAGISRLSSANTSSMGDVPNDLMTLLAQDPEGAVLLEKLRQHPNIDMEALLADTSSDEDSTNDAHAHAYVDADVDQHTNTIVHTSRSNLSDGLRAVVSGARRPSLVNTSQTGPNSSNTSKCNTPRRTSSLGVMLDKGMSMLDRQEEWERQRQKKAEEQEAARRQELEAELQECAVPPVDTAKSKRRWERAKATHRATVERMEAEENARIRQKELKKEAEERKKTAQLELQAAAKARHSVNRSQSQTDYYQKYPLPGKSSVQQENSKIPSTPRGEQHQSSPYVDKTHTTKTVVIHDENSRISNGVGNIENMSEDEFYRKAVERILQRQAQEDNNAHNRVSIPSSKAHESSGETSGSTHVWNSNERNDMLYPGDDLDAVDDGIWEGGGDESAVLYGSVNDIANDLNANNELPYGNGNGSQEHGSFSMKNTSSADVYTGYSTSSTANVWHSSKSQLQQTTTSIHTDHNTFSAHRPIPSTQTLPRSGPSTYFFDRATSTADKGRYRVRDARDFLPESISRKVDEPGVTVLVGREASAPNRQLAITVMFDRGKFNEEEAADWWKLNEKRFLAEI